MAAPWMRMKHAFNVFMKDTRKLVKNEFLLPSVGDPVDMVRFDTQRDCDRFQIVCDSSFGGKSTATLRLGEGSEPDTKSGVLSGYLSVAKGSNEELIRSGYVGMLTPAQFPPWDVSETPDIEVRCRTDGGCYAINVHCQLSFSSGLLYQGYVTIGADEWKTLRLPLPEFLPVLAGRVATGRWTPSLNRIIKVGVSVIGKQGPFRFELESIRALPPPEGKTLSDYEDDDL
ncbi:NADH:ubiquinone oxidoreductase intermediate-associated protein 30 domain-containing protein [Plasmodiophora brassicae]|uniref:NADH:ubiquinone oxidoreductase intermediate-associated protein 30 domain-containing protein n=1 Tax=Plasmodiophora brassicae TaxID=37360 RepID=A0A0G4IU67_PLABS|nr:hypothetical protein PBRA_007007 [Plasmodiophora brassicae]SPQ92963.1 unnamed protein product [Plasmodiophora brassicae]